MGVPLFTCTVFLVFCLLGLSWGSQELYFQSLPLPTSQPCTTGEVQVQGMLPRGEDPGGDT